MGCEGIASVPGFTEEWVIVHSLFQCVVLEANSLGRPCHKTRTLDHLSQGSHPGETADHQELREQETKPCDISKDFYGEFVTAAHWDQ